MAYWQCYYHLVWTTVKQAAVIEAAHETVIYNSVQEKVTALGCELYAVAAMPDHLHVVVAIAPGVSVADFVKQIKAATVKDVNASFDLKPKFKWQDGFGVLTLGQSRLDFAREYVLHQREHHARGSTNAALERTED